MDLLILLLEAYYYFSARIDYSIFDLSYNAEQFMGKVIAFNSVDVPRLIYITNCNTKIKFLAQERRNSLKTKFALKIKCIQTLFSSEESHNYQPSPNKRVK